jgi:acyl-coenzyme A synthetase/AMP-(fatty) acid ligase
LGERKVLVFKSKKFTNGQILDQANRLQRAFAKLSLGKKESAIMCLANHPMIFFVFQGIVRTGSAAILVMIELLNLN